MGMNNMNTLFELIKKADKGDPKAQWEAACRIVWDDPAEPIDPDWLERAVEYFKLAADQGYGDAMIDFGAIYVSGRGVAKNFKKAVYWYNKAAEILHPKAFRCLGYTFGYHNFSDGGYTDYKSAFSYFFKGAILNEQNCIYEIGDMYYYGRYVNIDQTFAFELYRRSDDIIDGDINDDSFANVRLRIAEFGYKWGKSKKYPNIYRKYLQNAIEGFEYRLVSNKEYEFFMSDYRKAKKLMREIEAGNTSYFAESAYIKTNDIEFTDNEILNYPEPEYPIIELEKLKIENPDITFWDKIRSFNDALSAAESGDSDSMYDVALFCFTKYENNANSREMITFSLYYYHKAIRYGRKSAAYNLGAIYSYGSGGVAIDRQKAFLLYRISNNEPSQGELGVYYARGELVEQNYEIAFKYFARCALGRKNWSYGSLQNLARMYREGIYVDIDKNFAEYCEKLGQSAEKEYKKNPTGKIAYRE